MDEDSESDSGSDHGSLLSCGSDIPELTPGYHPTADDVIAVRFFFLRYLPVELINDITNMAEYWPKVEVLRATAFQVHASLSNGVDHDARWCYAVTPSIPVRQEAGDVELHSKAQKVRFWTLSRDQGWGHEAENQGTYRGSYTWWEAAIIRPYDFASSFPTTFDVPREPVEILSGYAYEYPGAGHMEAEAEGQTKWHVQSNVTATHQVKTHEVIWQHGVIEEEATAFNGKGSGEGFLGALRPGDRIAIIARAMYPGWVNHVSGAGVEIFYSV